MSLSIVSLLSVDILSSYSPLSLNILVLKSLCIMLNRPLPSPLNVKKYLLTSTSFPFPVEGFILLVKRYLNSLLIFLLMSLSSYFNMLPSTSLSLMLSNPKYFYVLGVCDLTAFFIDLSAIIL